MFELVKKGLLAGLGMAVVTKDKMEKVFQTLVDEGKMSQEDAEKKVKELLDSGEKQWHEMEDKIRELVGDVLRSTNICSREEAEALSARITALEARLAALESPAGPGEAG